MKLLYRIALSLCALLLFTTFDLSVNAAIDIFEAKEGDVVDFTVLMGQLVRFPNRHHAQKKQLMFSLVGATIDAAEKANDTAAPAAEEEEADYWFQDSWNIDLGAGGGNGTEANGTTTNGTNANGTSWNLQMSDKTLVVIKVHDVENVTHYEFTWPGAELPNEKRELCLHYKDAHWYNSYQRYHPEWPLNNSHAMPRTPFNYLLDFQNNPQKEEFYLILEHLFVTSDGFAIMLDSTAPLFIRREPMGTEPTICLSVNNSYPYLENNPDATYRDIKVKMFAAANPKLVWDFVLQKSGLIRKPTGTPGDKAFMNPSFTVATQYGPFISRDSVYQLASQIEKEGLWNSEIVLNNLWEQNKGDFKFNQGLFGSAQEMTARLHSEKFRVKVSVNPQIWDTQQNIESHRVLYVKPQTGDQPTTFIDFATEEACGFYESELKKLHFSDGVDSFYIVSDSLRNFRLADYFMQLTPSLLTKKYIETVAIASPNSTTTLAFKTQALPAMVQLTAYAQTPFDQLLKTMIPNALAASLGGYAFVSPYHIGGFWPGQRPSEEIYIRMAQAAALMPSMTFSVVPWAPYYSSKVTDAVKKALDLHQKYAPLIISLAAKRVTDGTPILRPMWYESPEDENAYLAADQFMLGDDLVVAPVVEVGKKQRSVYIPHGIWLDAHNIPIKGPTMKQVAADLDQDVPHFTRKV